MNITVTYMSGAGNLFTVIDGRNLSLSNKDWKQNSLRLCSGEIKTEGLIIIKNIYLTTQSDSVNLHFDANFYNPDGSFGAMCGNGGRCAVRYALELIDSDNKFSISYITFTMAGSNYKAIYDNHEICVYFPMPKEKKLNVTVTNNVTSVTGDYIDVGAQHFVINYKQICYELPFDNFNLELFAPSFRNHPEFAPFGANINIFQIENNIIQLRTFERGVEAETGACGTGAISTAISAITNNLAYSPVTIIPTSKIPLTVGYEPEIALVWLEGSAEFIGQSNFQINF
ncbi:MAG: diaminopimelate epimerase [Bacteroidetes bacterium]|nr:diaminopimelate epimerase [Bacteroidota bacterium]